MSEVLSAATIWPVKNSLAFRIAGGLLELLFPARCVGCGAYGSFLCAPCQEQMTVARDPRCPVCWMPEQARCGCTTRRFAFLAARSPFIYAGVVREAVHAFKYRGISALAPILAAPMAETLAHWDPPVDLLVPVPLSGLRRRQRGFNQAELLARELARESRKALAPFALRRRGGRPQARSLDEAARHVNVANVFHAEGRLVAGKSVLLVDDVLTSGATLNACAKALLEAGARDVRCLTLARED